MKKEKTMSSHTIRPDSVRKNKSASVLSIFMGAPGVALWWLIYQQLPKVSKWLTYDLLPISQGSHLGDSVEFFLYSTPKVMMLSWLSSTWKRKLSVGSGYMSSSVLPYCRYSRVCPGGHDGVHHGQRLMVVCAGFDSY